MIIVALSAGVASAASVVLGPTPYAQASDSPFASTTFNDYFYLENFEDHALNTPGVSASAGQAATIQFAPAIDHDSVDEDDGAVDGVVNPGHDSWYSDGATGVSFNFDAGALGGLPTHAGIVWTDGLGQITFKAYGPGDALLATIGPISEAGVFPDGTTLPQPAEDRFFGVSDAGGISRIFLSNSVGGIEMDHLQYGRVSVTEPPPTGIPLPAAIWSGVSLLAAMGAKSLRRRAVA